MRGAPGSCSAPSRGPSRAVEREWTDVPRTRVQSRSRGGLPCSGAHVAGARPAHLRPRDRARRAGRRAVLRRCPGTRGPRRSFLGGEPAGHSRPLLRLLAGLGLLTVGGDLLGRGLRDVVARFDVSGTLLGNTVVAASVEAEEVARVVVPARRARGDVAL